MDLAIHLQHRSQGTTAQAGNLLQIKTPVGSGLTGSDANLPFQHVAQHLTTLDMAGSAQANLDGVSPWWGKPELRIERGHPIDTVFGYFKKSGYGMDIFRGQISLLLLNLLEQGNQVPFSPLEQG